MLAPLGASSSLEIIGDYMDIKYLLLFFSKYQPRRLRTIENVLIGHKTVSTLYLGMQYNILDYLGIFPELNKKQDQLNIKYLLYKQYLVKVDQYKYKLTNLGMQKKNNIKATHYIPKYLKLNCMYDINMIQNRLLLAIQIVSEYSFNNRNYYPFQIDFYNSRLIKYWFHNYKGKMLISDLYHFIYKFLNQLPNDLAWQFTGSLIGHDKPGMTLSQQSNYLHKSILEIYLRQIDLFCMFTNYLRKNNNKILKLLLYQSKCSLISKSALITLQLFENNYSIRYISKHRNIKLSTVKEHLLEVAILTTKSQFPYSKVFNKYTLSTLKNNLKGSISKWKFEDVKYDNVDFFHFRMYQILRSKLNE